MYCRAVPHPCQHLSKSPRASTGPGGCAVTQSTFAACTSRFPPHRLRQQWWRQHRHRRRQPSVPPPQQRTARAVSQPAGAAAALSPAHTRPARPAAAAGNLRTVPTAAAGNLRTVPTAAAGNLRTVEIAAAGVGCQACNKHTAARVRHGRQGLSAGRQAGVPAGGRMLRA
jgi:hypothetical protein